LSSYLRLRLLIRVGSLGRDSVEREESENIEREMRQSKKTDIKDIKRRQKIGKKGNPEINPVGQELL